MYGSVFNTSPNESKSEVVERYRKKWIFRKITKRKVIFLKNKTLIKCTNIFGLCAFFLTFIKIKKYQNETTNKNTNLLHSIFSISFYNFTFAFVRRGIKNRSVHYFRLWFCRFKPDLYFLRPKMDAFTQCNLFYRYCCFKFIYRSAICQNKIDKMAFVNIAVFTK